MKIRLQLILLFGSLFILLAVLTFYLFKEQPLFLIAAEACLFLMLLAFIWLLGRITKPLSQIALGLDALKDQDFSGILRPTPSSEINRLIEVYNKMVENIRQERIFQKEQHFFLQNLIESLPVGLIILDFDDNISEYNPVARDLLTLNENQKGLKFQEITFPLSNSFLEQALQTPKIYKLNGSRYLRVYTDRFRNRGFYQKFIIIEDAGEEILKLEKDAYGKVIRMMAHEVKNSVGAINSILDTLIHTETVPEEEKKAYLQIVADRNISLNAFMENFAGVVRLTLPEMQAFNLSVSVNSVYHLMKLKHQHKPVDFLLDMPQHPVIIKGNREQLEQVLINVILNAFEAMPDEGTIKLQLSPSSLLISDTGTGISEVAKQKLFTPFFSTKTNGQGVGLTMAREILSNHGFRFDLNSEHGKTVFSIHW
jgi:two-component system nitrogen regulation sensor histidine kinase NtrY